ncbi:MAG: DNA recombination/repair protein RecA, partial [Firmicutes bacterium HGW-Firmicutes-10]
MENSKRDQLLDDAIKQIEKQYGKGSIMRLGDRAHVEVDAISSGSLA